MNHPLKFLSQNLSKPFFFFFLSGTLAIFGLFRFLDLPLQTPAAPNGIVSFELAGNAESARAMVESWDTNARLFAAFGLGFDYLFMPVYALALSLGLLLAGNGKVNWYRSSSVWLGWGAFVAALFDAVENYSLWQELSAGVFTPFAPIAAFCASIKFFLLVAGFLVAVLGWFVRKE